MPFRDNRGPLEDLYALHIPNCDKRGQYNLKQVTLGGRLISSQQRKPYLITILSHNLQFLFLLDRENREGFFCFFFTEGCFCKNTATHSRFHVAPVSRLQCFCVCFSARCLSTASGASAGASTRTLADQSHRPPPCGGTPTAASTSESWSWSSPTLPRYKRGMTEQRNCKSTREQRTSD